jgi:Tfp pilus assembly protein PilO
MKIGPFEQVMIAIAVAVVIVAVVAGVFVWPQYQSLGQLSGEIAAARSEEQQVQTEVKILTGSKNAAVETDAKWLRLANLVPDNPDLPSLIVELQDTAFKSGVQIMSLSPVAPAERTNGYAIPVNIQIVGSWEDTVDFVQRVMKINRGLRVVSASSGRTTNDTANKNISLPRYAVSTIIKVEAYMIPPADTTSTPNPGTPTPAPAGN